MTLEYLSGNYSVLKFKPTDNIPLSILNSTFFNITKTKEELSIVCYSNDAPESDNCEKDWSLIKVLGPLDFSLTGILSSIASPLADEKISIFAISTFDTDYIMVKEDKIEAAKSCLREAGFQI